MKLVSLFALVTLGLTHVGCQETPSAQANESETAEKRDADAPKAKPSSAPVATATPAPPPEPRPIAAVREGKMVHPLTKQEVPLVEMSLAKCYGFKGYSMKVPEGSKLTTLVGARACAIEFPDAKNTGLMVMTDEVKVKWWKRTELENVKTKHLDDPDAFLYEYEAKGKLKLLGWLDKKLGPHNVKCNAMGDDDKLKLTLEEERGVIEVCRTLRYEEPKKK
jgi:hypothetical protein